MDPDRKAELERILAECDALPDDPEAQAAGRMLRKFVYGPPPPPRTPFADRMRELTQEYALALVDEDLSRQRELTKIMRMMILSAFSQGSDAKH